MPKKGYKQTEEHRTKTSAAAKAAHARPGTKDKQRAATKAALARPEIKVKQSIGIKIKWQDPEYAKKVFTGNPSNIERYANSKLKKLKVPYIWGHDKPICLQTARLGTYYPDFYLTKLNIYLEIKYGTYYMDQGGRKTSQEDQGAQETGV